MKLTSDNTINANSLLYKAPAYLVHVGAAVLVALVVTAPMVF